MLAGVPFVIGIRGFYPLQSIQTGSGTNQGTNFVDFVQVSNEIYPVGLMQ
jgi:hypothetical protein